jgi:hypothetical protein
MAGSAAEPRRRRATAEVRVVRAGVDEAANAKHDALYGLRVPIEKRAALVWELSVEAFSIRATR